MSNENKQPAKPPISDAEHRMIFSGPAPVANRFFVHTAGWVRLTFAEQGTPNTVPAFRSAVVLSIADAVALVGLLANALEQVKLGSLPTNAPAPKAPSKHLRGVDTPLSS